jgi:hypothetical protein
MATPPTKTDASDKGSGNLGANPSDGVVQQVIREVGVAIPPLPKRTTPIGPC